MRHLLCAFFAIALGCSRGQPPLVVAATYGNVATARTLIAAGADPNVCGAPDGVSIVSPLIAAAANGHGAVVDELLQAGAVVDLACGGNTAMGAAVTNGHVDVVKRLIVAGADVSAKGAGGWTYLMQAAIAAEADVIPVLVAAGCPLEATRPAVREAIDDAEGQTALMIAAGWDARPTGALILAGANVNARDAAGSTPLIHAIKGAIWTAQNGPTTPGKWDVSIVAMLLEAGADVKVIDSSGQTATQLAAQAGSNADAIRELLRNAAGKVSCRLTSRRT